jgi:UDP-GlcNAc:undecaprenyl-phosphate GlcNAc-1-phosphate transferase
MLNLISILVTAYLSAHIAIKLIKPLAIGVGLVDKPNTRKLHKGDIPLVGGLSIYLSVLIVTLMWMPNTVGIRMYLIASAMIVFIGTLDDMYDLKVGHRLVGQFIVASILINGLNVYFTNFGDLLSFGDINIGVLGIPFTYLSILVLINAFNMIDGLDDYLVLCKIKSKQHLIL